MTSRERVRNALRFEEIDRLPYDLPFDYGSDFHYCNLLPFPENKPESGPDMWNCVWENISGSSFGEVKTFPLADWDFSQVAFPDVQSAGCYAHLEDVRRQAGDRFLVGYGLSLYDRAHYLRGMENLWMDIHLERDKLEMLLDKLTELAIQVVEQYARHGVDCIYSWDDWGVQDRLMISPDSWRELWKERYARIYQRCHELGMCTILHSCGYIVDILDDLIEIGCQCIQMDQQQNMGLETLGKRFGGRINFFSPADIQNIMIHGSESDIRAYCRAMKRHLSTGRNRGGLIPKYYIAWQAIGHDELKLRAMSDEFRKLSQITEKES